MTLTLFKYLVRSLNKRTEPRLRRGKLSSLRRFATRNGFCIAPQNIGIVFAHVS
jgi:hypothetical protein